MERKIFFYRLGVITNGGVQYDSPRKREIQFIIIMWRSKYNNLIKGAKRKVSKESSNCTCSSKTSKIRRTSESRRLGENEAIPILTWPWLGHEGGFPNHACIRWFSNEFSLLMKPLVPYFSYCSRVFLLPVSLLLLRDEVLRVIYREVFLR